MPNSNPEQLNELAAKKLKNINPLNKLTPTPNPMAAIRKQKPEHAWEIGLMEDTIGIMRPLTKEEKARVTRWVMFWEKTYWMWINDSIPTMSSEELEKWKTNAKLKLEEFSKMWTAFGEVVSGKEAKESVEKLSDSIIKFGAAITYVTTMFSGKMMVKYRPEVKLALDSAILIFQQSIADVGAGALSTAIGPLATAPKLLFNTIQSISKSMQFTAVALQGITEAGFLTALGFDQGLQPLLELMKSAQEAVDSIKIIVNDATNVLNQEPPTKEVSDNITKIEMSIPATKAVQVVQQAAQQAARQAAQQAPAQQAPAQAQQAPAQQAPVAPVAPVAPAQQAPQAPVAPQAPQAPAQQAPAPQAPAPQAPAQTGGKSKTLKKIKKRKGRKGRKSRKSIKSRKSRKY